MIKVDYIVARDIDKVAKFHSNKKYLNWILKIIDNEYRFYPPILIESNDEDYLDEFEFSDSYDDSFLRNVTVEEYESKNTFVPLVGEVWDKTMKFIETEKFVFFDEIEEIKEEIVTIKKASSKKINLLKHSTNKKISLNNYKKINKNKYKELDYKLYKSNNGRGILNKLNKYKDEVLEEYFNTPVLLPIEEE